jgi:hypothetical protein
LLSGCRSVETPTARKAAYPVPPVSLSEFFNHPVDGVYSVPESAVSEEDLLSHNIIVVSGGVVRLSRFQNGRVSTNQWDFVEFRPALPGENMIQQIAAGAAERDIELRFGKPNREGFDYYPIIGLKSGSTKHVVYSWFTLSEMSQFTFLRVNITYRKAKDADWRVESISWGKWGGRRFSSNHSIQRTAASRLAELQFQPQWRLAPAADADRWTEHTA